jgi:chemotaxis protein histidine kinase CheA
MAALLAAGSIGVATVSAAPKNAAPETPLTAAGNKLLAKYSDLLKAVQEEVSKALPKTDASRKAALMKAGEATKAAEAEAAAAQQALGKIQSAKGLVDHAKGKWIGGAEKGIAQAEAALKKATTAAEREAAKQELAKWQANKEDGLKALKERQEALDKVKRDEPKLTKANQAAQAALAKAQATEAAAAKALLATLESCLASNQLDAKLVKGAMLAEATPHGLAGFAQQGKDQEALVDKLLADTALLKQMLEAGGAKFGNYGRAMEIYTAIQQASPQAREGTLQRLALATSLEHAKPIEQSKAADQTNAPATVDPVKRYLHYEQAFLKGELDPAFKHFSVWEYRMVVGCDAPDEILAWGREMLRNYRPDHIYTPDYGWRYSATVRTEVPYGSQNVKLDRPSLHNYQNIIMNGGVCGRRAFFGRFILRSFGIPTWGVTQKAHAALSHWTPKGWVVNLGAGFGSSWWDKDEVPRSGADFLLETQARAHPQEYLKVLRAQWISRILGEEQYNDRKRVAGGYWSGMAHYQAGVIAATAVELGPLGQELAEANEPKEKTPAAQAKLAEEDRKVVLGQDGTITIPAVAHAKPAGQSVAMKSFAGGMQLHCTGGFKAEYAVAAPRAGKYMLTVKVATVQVGQKFLLTTADAKAPVAIEVPYTLGKWQPTQPVEVSLGSGRNVLHLALQDGSRGVTLKDITLTPVK